MLEREGGNDRDSLDSPTKQWSDVLLLRRMSPWSEVLEVRRVSNSVSDGTEQNNGLEYSKLRRANVCM